MNPRVTRFYQTRAQKIANNIAKKRFEPHLHRSLPILGKGAYGTVFQLTDDIALKVGHKVFQEAEIHKVILQTLGPRCSRYFLKHYDVKDYPGLEDIGQEFVQKMYSKTPQEFSFIEFLDPNQWTQLERLRKQNPPNLARINRRILNASRCLWTIGFLHKDLHGGNIMVHKKTGAVKIIDYGLTQKMKHISEKIPRFKSVQQARTWFQRRSISISSNLRWTMDKRFQSSSRSSNSSSNRTDEW